MPSSREIAFMPARVLLQDFTGVPAVVDLAAMRDAMTRLGGDPVRINPLLPVELVIDHSVQVDEFGNAGAFAANERLEFERNRERYGFLRWGQKAFRNFEVVPPDTGIVHQVNLEYLARVVFVASKAGSALSVEAPLAYPDTLVGTDSHTTMINGLGVLGWGVGGIEAEAAMLGQPLSMLIPEVVGFKLIGRLKEGTTATDLVLTVTQMLRQKGVVGKFVEFFGPGLADLPLADRATIANMAPEYGATCGIFPVDAETLRYLRISGRPEQLVALVEAYMKEQGMFHDAGTPEAVYSDTLSLDLAAVEPSSAGPRPAARPREPVPGSRRTSPSNCPASTGAAKPKGMSTGPAARGRRRAGRGGCRRLRQGRHRAHRRHHELHEHQQSQRHARRRLARQESRRAATPTTRPWVKTRLSPGSKVVTEYLNAAGLMPSLSRQHALPPAGYGCMTCIAAGTPVLEANGTATRIERMPSAGGSVLLAPGTDGKLGPAVQAEAFPQGERRECVRLTLCDGRQLVCTPDHEILTADGRWVRAEAARPRDERVVVGLDAPLDEPGADEAGWVLSASEMTLSMGTSQDRRRSLAFARLLGHVLGDGSISTAGQGRMNVGQALDREAALSDIELLTGKRPVAAAYDERKWSIVLPSRLYRGHRFAARRARR